MREVAFSELCDFTEKQWAATEAADTHRYTLYGGARGPGKSYWLRWYLLRRLLLFAGRGLKGVRSGLFCEDYPVLRDRQISKIKTEFPAWLGELKETQEDGLGFFLWPAYGSGVLCLRNLDDPSKYQSAEFADVGVDELTKNKHPLFDILRGSMRWPMVEDNKWVSGSNPGDVGHLWVRQYWIDRIYPPELEGKRNEFVFVRALPKDNPHLTQSYWDELNSITDPALRRAWIYGDWDVFAGQAFGEWRRDRHVIPPRELPKQWPKWRAVDWGHQKPFCCLWLTNDPDTGRVIVYREAYQAGLTDREQARKIKQMSAEPVRFTVADPSMWTKKTHENQTFSTADEYMAEGVPLEPADNDRIQGVRRVRSALSGDPPGLQVFETCPNLIRTLPALPYDPVRIEDVDTDAEDHAYDALRYGLMRGQQKQRQRQQPARDPYAFVEGR